MQYAIALDLSNPFDVVWLYAPSTSLASRCTYLLVNMMRWPFAVLYFMGIRVRTDVFDVGFWEDAPMKTMCAHWTTVPTDHWETYPMDCIAMVQAKFNAFFVVSIMSMVVISAVSFTRWWFWYRYVWKPVAITVRRLSPSNLLQVMDAHHRRAAKCE